MRLRKLKTLNRIAIGTLLGIALSGIRPASAQDKSGYVNVRDFIDSPEFAGQKDHTAAIRAASAKGAHALLFPPGHYYVSDTITMAVGAGEVVGHGYPTIHQSNPEKDIFYNDQAWRLTIRGLQFKGGRDQIAIGNKNVDQGFLLISDCRFFDSEGAAIRFLGGPGYAPKTTASTYSLVEKCAFQNNAQVLISVSDDAVFQDAWISTKPHLSNKAVIENYGGLSVQQVIGVPRPRGTDQRWFDNYGSLAIRRFRFGGEGAGFTPVVNYAKYSPGEWGNSVIIEDSFLAALGNNKRACAVYLEEIPNQVVIRNCNVAYVPAVIVDKKIDLKTYFDGARPGMFEFDISHNVGEFAGVLPDEMLAAEARRKMTPYEYGDRQLTPAKTEQALAAAITRAKTLPSAAPGEFGGHKQQTVSGACLDITPSTHEWSLADSLDGVVERCDDYLAIAESGDDIVLLRRLEGARTYPHVRIRNIEVDLDKTPYLTWRFKDNSADVKGGHFGVKVIDVETQGMATLIENYNADQYGYYAFDLRKHLGVRQGKRMIDVKFYLCDGRHYGSMAKDFIAIRKGEYLVMDFLRLEAAR